MPQRKTMSRDELSTIIHFAPTPLVVLDRNRCLARVNKLAQTTLGIDAKYCNGEAFSQWIVEGSQIAFAKALNHAAESKWSTVDNGDDWARPGSTVVALQSRRTALDQPGVPFWANVTVTACFENLPEANSAGYLHEAFYILCVSPISGLEKGKGHDRFTPKQSAEEQQLIAEEGRRTPRLRSSSLSNAAELSSSPSAPPVIHSLSESIMHNFDFPMCALTSDGQTFVRNRAMDGLLGVLSSSYEALDDTQNPGDSLPGDRDDEGSENSSSRDSNRTTSASRTEVDASWLFSHFKVFDPTFTTPMPESEYPLFKAAVLGQRFKHAIIGVIAADGARRVLECEGWPVYDAEGHGNFIGGMLVLEDVTRKRAQFQAEQALQLDYSTPHNRMLPGSQHYWQHLCQEFPEISWVANGQGYLEWYNKQWYEFTGATEEQSLGAGWTSYVHDEDLPSASKTWSKALRTSSRYEIQERIRAADGTYRWMLCRAHPYRDSSGTIVKWFGTLTDIHTTLLTLSANREAKENLSDAVRLADITLWSVDMEGKFTLAEGTLSGVDNVDHTGSSASVSGSTSSGSEEHRHSLGRLNPSQAPIIGRSIYEEWGAATRVPIERAMAGELVTEEVRIRDRQYRVHFRPRRARMSAPTSFLLSHEDEEAPIIGVAGISFDITERIHLERKMAESIREVTKAEASLAAAKEASRMKSQFLAVISHEIRTPLNGVVGLSELLLDIEELPEEAQDLVHAILRSSGALLSVINDVLDFSKVEAGKLDLVSVPFSLNLVLQDAVRDFQKLLGNKGLALAQDIQVPSDGLVLGDAGRITQVLNNLLSNAGKFTDKGVVKFSARMSRVGDLGANYTFTVSDTGCGIPRSQHSLLFQPFRQADPSTSRKYGGSGLGLAICKNLIELMGGEISLDSEEGRGTTVTFTVPLANAPPPRPQLTGPLDLQQKFATTLALEQMQTQKRTKEAEKADDSSDDEELPYIEPVTAHKRQSTEALGFRRSSTVSLLPVEGQLAALPQRKPRILLAEDNPINSQIAIKTLCKLGYDVDHVENGAEVLEAFVTRSYDLVLMDCHMPHVDGYAATRRMRQSSSPLMRRIPVIALTAAAIKGRDLCLAAGMSDYLSKPVRRVTLDAMLKKWVGREHDETTSGVVSPDADTSRDDMELLATPMNEKPNPTDLLPLPVVPAVPAA